jgi:hypothetical protein
MNIRTRTIYDLITSQDRKVGIDGPLEPVGLDGFVVSLSFVNIVDRTTDSKCRRFAGCDQTSWNAKKRGSVIAVRSPRTAQVDVSRTINIAQVGVFHTPPFSFNAAKTTWKIAIAHPAPICL